MEARKEEEKGEERGEMKIRSTAYPILFILFLWGCSNTRFLTDDQVLYTGRQKVHIAASKMDKNSASVKMQVNSATDFKVNNALFGRRMLPPIGLWVHNYWKLNEEKKFGSWAYKSLAGSPILISDVNPELRAQKIESDLFDLGYFQANAWSVVDTSSKNSKKARISYFVDLSPPYTYNKIDIISDNVSIDTLMRTESLENQITTGDQFNLEKLTIARDGLSRQIQNKGFLYFTPDFIALDLDTTIGRSQMNLEVRKKTELPPEVLARYETDHIVLHVSRPSDTAFVLPDTTYYEDLCIISSGDYLKPNILGSAVFFKKGDLYSFDTYQNTITRLNGLGIFSYVRISYETTGEDSLLRLMDVRIDLILADNISAEFEANVVTKSTGFTGPAISAEVSHGNAFKGATKIHVGLNGGIEWQWGQKQEDQLGTFSYDLGVSSGLTFPRLLLPEKRKKNLSRMIQQTSINLDVNLLNRTAYYSMFSTKTNLKYTWGTSREMQHSYSPVYINSVFLLATTPAFDSVVDENIYIRKSFEEQFIVGMRYDFSYDNTFRPQPYNIFFQGGVSSSGNLLDLINRVGKDPADRPYTSMGNVYSQYIKLTSDFRFYINGFNKTLVLRMYAGVGIPYLNSTVLPYVEQFFSGGAYSIRGFTARTLGPGSFHEVESSYIDQSGDVKLEGNLEYRFGISKVVKGAVFIDAGNIWLVNEDENRPGAKFEFDSFYRQLAIGSGVGLRFDFNFFVLRADLGFPIRTPYLLDDSNWQLGTGKLFSKGMFYLAIGYPF
jgi:outer membrane protein assembly factor BamA